MPAAVSPSSGSYGGHQVRSDGQSTPSPEITYDCGITKTGKYGLFALSLFFSMFFVGGVLGK